MKRGITIPKLSSNLKADTWVKVYEATLTEAATSLTISNLLGDTDNEYKLEARIVNGYNGAANYRIRPNNDSGTNYGHQVINAVDSAVAAARGTATGILMSNASTALGDVNQDSVIIQAKSGYVRTVIHEFATKVVTTTITRLYLLGQSWNNTADQITSLVILSDRANGLGIGSRIVLWKKVAK